MVLNTYEISYCKKAWACFKKINFDKSGCFFVNLKHKKDVSTK